MGRYLFSIAVFLAFFIPLETFASSAVQATAPDQNTPTLPGKPISVPNNTLVLGKLLTNLDSATAKAGEPVEVRIDEDIKSGHRVRVPKGSILNGHLTSVRPFSTEASQSVIAILFDRITLKNGEQIALNLTIHALAPQMDMKTDTLEDVRGMRGVEQDALAAGHLDTTTGTIDGLSHESRGVYGLKGISIVNQSEKGERISLVVSKSENLRLKKGSQLVMQVVSRKSSLREAASAPASAPPNENSAFLVPPGVDDFVPTVSTGVTCNLPAVLHGVGTRMSQLVENLEKFSATEHIDHYKVDSAGEARSEETRSFEYVVTVLQDPVSGFQLDEYRNGSTDPAQFPAGIATEALPVMALIFHPLLASDFNMSCEGLGQWSGHKAWQVRFEQRPDHPNRIRYYKIQGNYYPVALKGRAWIDSSNFQVLRLETDLVKPIKVIDLAYEHLSIEYGEVEFRSHNVQLWLPKTAELYWERHGHRYYRRHDFSDFKVFAVDTHQNQNLPKGSYSFTNTSSQDVTGVLTVTPIAGSNLKAVSVKFVVPAGGSVLKSLGPGKDVAIPGELVESARYVYQGPEGSVSVEANLATQSTLEVVPEPAQ
jgi:hypothetical protein